MEKLTEKKSIGELKGMENIKKIEEMAKNLITEVDNIYNELNTDLKGFRVQDAKQCSNNELVKICVEDVKRIEEVNKEIQYKDKELKEINSKIKKILGTMEELRTSMKLGKFSVIKALEESGKSQKENKELEKYKELKKEYNKLDEDRKKINVKIDSLRYLKNIINNNIKELKYIIIFKIAEEIFTKIDGKKITKRATTAILKKYSELFDCNTCDIYISIENIDSMKIIKFTHKDDYIAYNYSHRLYITSGIIDAVKLIEKLDNHINNIKIYSFNNIEDIKKIIIVKNKISKILQPLNNNVNSRILNIDTII